MIIIFIIILLLIMSKFAYACHQMRVAAIIAIGYMNTALYVY